MGYELDDGLVCHMTRMGDILDAAMRGSSVVFSFAVHSQIWGWRNAKHITNAKQSRNAKHNSISVLKSLVQLECSFRALHPD